MRTPSDVLDICTLRGMNSGIEIKDTSTSLNKGMLIVLCYNMLLSVHLPSTEIETVGTPDDDGSVEVVKR